MEPFFSQNTNNNPIDLYKDVSKSNIIHKPLAWRRVGLPLERVDSEVKHPALSRSKTLFDYSKKKINTCYFVAFKITGQLIGHCRRVCLRNLVVSNVSDAEYHSKRGKSLVLCLVSVVLSEAEFTVVRKYFSGLYRAEAELVPIHHHHHAWTFLDFLWRCSPEPDRQRRGSPAKSLHCRHGLSFPLCSLGLSSSPSIVAAFPRSFGSAPACLPLRLNPSTHPSISSFRSGPLAPTS